MTVYIDPLMTHGWKLRGRPVQNCHMFTDCEQLDELHAVAEKIGMKRQWFQAGASVPHYDLTPIKAALAVASGAVEVDRKRAVELWRIIRARKAGLL